MLLPKTQVGSVLLEDLALVAGEGTTLLHSNPVQMGHGVASGEKSALSNQM